MRYTIRCVTCRAEITVGGHDEDDVNATVLDEDDDAWTDACRHIREGGDYTIVHAEPDYYEEL